MSDQSETHVERINPEVPQDPHRPEDEFGDKSHLTIDRQPPPEPPAPEERGERKPYRLTVKSVHDGILYPAGSVVALYDDEVGPQHIPAPGIEPALPTRPVVTPVDERDVELGALRTERDNLSMELAAAKADRDSFAQQIEDMNAAVASASEAAEKAQLSQREAEQKLHEMQDENAELHRTLEAATAPTPAPEEDKSEPEKSDG